MQAVIFKGVRKIATENRPIPTCKDSSDVVIKVHVTALCGSDLHIYRGHEFGETDIIMVSRMFQILIQIGLLLI